MAVEMRCFLKTAQGRAIMQREAQKRSRHLLPEPGAIYYDYFCTVKVEELTVKEFFFPSKLPLQIAWETIEKISYGPQSKEPTDAVKIKGFDKFGFWWATDDCRTKKRDLMMHNVRIERSTEPGKLGFSVLNIEAFLESCRLFLPFECTVSGTL